LHYETVSKVVSENWVASVKDLVYPYFDIYSINGTVDARINSTLYIYRFWSINGFCNNTFQKNFGGYGQGLIDIFGFTTVSFNNDTFLENGENVIEVVA
jgi:hypothetical protein